MGTLETVGIIIAILTLASSILFHLFKTTWWMATLTTTLTTLTSAVQKIEERIIKFEGDFCKKEDKDKDVGRLEQSIQAAHRRIDDIHNVYEQR